MKEPVITVVTVVFNGVKTLEATMASVFSQTYQHIEYVVIDGASTDGSVELIKRNEKKIARIVSEPDRGIYDAMNKALKICSGDWIYFLGSDDVLMSESVIAEVAKYLVDGNEIVYGDVLFKNAKRRYDGKFNSFKIVTRNISHQAIFYPRKVFQTFRFETRYRIFADYHLNLLLFGRREWQFKYVPVLIAEFNDEGASGSRVKDPEFEKDRLAIIRNNFSWIVFVYKLVRTTVASALRAR